MTNSRPLEYKMPNKLFKAYLEQRTEAEKKINPYVYVMNILNENAGLRGTVKKILISDAE